MGNILKTLAEKKRELSPMFVRIVDYVIQHPEKVMSETITNTAEKAGVSVGTISRFCKEIGFGSFTDFKVAIARSHQHPNPSETAAEGSYSGLKELMSIIDANLSIADQDHIEAAARLIHDSNHVLLLGAQTSSCALEFVRDNLIRLGILAIRINDVHDVLSCALEGKQSTAIVFSDELVSETTIGLLAELRESKVNIISLGKNSMSPVMSISDITLIPISNDHTKPGFGLPKVIGELLLSDMLLRHLVELDEKYPESLNKNAQRSFSIQAVIHGLSKKFM